LFGLNLQFLDYDRMEERRIVQEAIDAEFADNPQTLTDKLMELCVPNLKFNKEEKDRFNLENCTICLEEYKEGDDLRRIVICDHNFHQVCFEQWLKKREVNSKFFIFFCLEK